MAHTDRVSLPDGRTAQLWVGGEVDDAVDRPVVVFCHGCPDTRHAAMTGEQAARAAGVRLLAVNRPGYGESDVHASSQVSVADDIMAVADLLGIDRFAVLGMSIGGPYALALAARYPERVTALAVVAAPSPGECLRRAAPGSVDETVARNRPEFAAWVASVAPDDPDDEALTRRWLAQHPAEDAMLIAQLSAHDVAASVREALAHDDGYLRDAAITFRHWELDLADVAAPTTLWYGEHDTNAPPENGRELAELLPHATLQLRPTTHLATLLTGWPEILASLQH